MTKVDSKSSDQKLFAAKFTPSKLSRHLCRGGVLVKGVPTEGVIVGVGEPIAPLLLHTGLFPESQNIALPPHWRGVWSAAMHHILVVDGHIPSLDWHIDWNLLWAELCHQRM